MEGKRVQLKSIVSIVDREGNYYDFNEYNQPDSEELTEGKDDFLQEKMGWEKILMIKNLSHQIVWTKKVNPYHLSLGGEQVYDRRLSYIMSNLLKGVVVNGTGRRAERV